MIRTSLLVLCLALSPAVAQASNWADGLFHGLDRDFGAVKRGAQLNHSFLLTNNTGSEVRIKSIQVSCGCTQAVARSKIIPPGQSTSIDCTMETNGFEGSKTVSIYVRFDRPRRAQASLRLNCVSQANVPGGVHEVDFGIVTQGSCAERRLNLDYVGKPDWQVESLDYGNANLQVEIQEVSRSTERVRYELKVALCKDQPAGTLEDRVRIQTNDPQVPQIVVVVKALVEPTLVVAPDTLRLSPLVPGQTITKNLMVKASHPFKVVRVENTNGLFKVKSSPTEKTTQLIVVTLEVPQDVSQVPDHLEVITNLEGEQSVPVNIDR